MIKVRQTPSGTEGAVNIIFTTGDCSPFLDLRSDGDMGIDVSNPTDQKIVLCIYATAPANLITDGIYDGNGPVGSKYDNNGTIEWTPSIQLVEGANSISISEFFPTHDSNENNLAINSNGENGLFGLTFYFRGPNDDQLALPPTSFYVNHIEIGEASSINDCSFPTITDIQKDQNKSSFEIFPNPIQGDELNFSKELNNIRVTNTTGIVVLEVTKASKINISALEQGVYIIKANEGTSKLVIE